MTNLSRRKFVKGAAIAGLSAGATSLWPNSASGRESLTVVEWGPPWIGPSTAIAKDWGKADINWVLHGNSGAAILAKIKASWPNSPYDVVDNWSPVFIQMVKEGWAETVTAEEIPNLKDIPEQFITKDKDGNWKNVPRNINGGFFSVRTDTCPIEIKTIEDLLDPRLKGQICWPHPLQFMNAQGAVLALARGGNERNMDPGWAFLDQIVKARNIGRIYSSTTDVTNSVSTGETSVTFASEATIGSIMKKVPIKQLTKVHPTLKSVIFVEGWVIMANSKHKKEAKEFANFMISPEATDAFLSSVAGAPANKKATKQTRLAHLTFTPEEMEKFAYFPDYGYMGEQLNGWVRRFEQEVMPKL